jgi:hypothetical protein
MNCSNTTNDWFPQQIGEEDDYQQFLTKLTSKIKVIPPLDVKLKHLQKKKLGCFHKEGVDLPFSHENVDPRLLNDYITPVVQEMINDLKEGESYFISLGRSGDGKIRAIFDVARGVFYYLYRMCFKER